MDGRTHIGINQQVLSKLARNTPLVSYENYIACRLVAPGLPPNACLPPTPAQPIRGFAYANADPDSRALAVLAILAHEVGHVIWWDTNVSRRKCLSWYFYQLSGWPKYDLPHRFRRFAMADSDEQIPGGVNVFQVQRDVPSAPDTSSLNIARVYAGEWAGLFSTVSLDEDFIETYKLFVLTQAGMSQNLKHLIVKIPNQREVDVIVDNFFKPSQSAKSLYFKNGWIGAWLDGNSCSG